MNFIFLGAQEQEFWKSFIPAIGPIVAALITTIGVIWTARSSLKKLKIDQKATPTELTRYKEWLEIAEKYKSVYMKQDSNGPDHGGQWNSIKESCEAALHAASWERIVLNETPQGYAQKKLLKLDSNYITSKIFVKTDSGEPNNIELPNLVGTIFTIWIIIITMVFGFALLYFVYEIFSWENLLLSAGFLLLLGYLWWLVTFLTYPVGHIIPDLYLRKIAFDYKVRPRNPTRMDRYFRIRGSLAGRGSPEDVTNYIHLPCKGGVIPHLIITIPFVIIIFACSKKHYGCMKDEIKYLDLEEERIKKKEERRKAIKLIYFYIFLFSIFIFI